MLIYVIAGEPSGDSLGGRLIEALRQENPQVKFAGVGGENMQKAGVSSLFDISDLAVMGLAEVIPSIPKVLRRIKETVADIEAKKPDAVITIDSWSFSARVHKALRKKGIKVLQIHYVAPQVWAWKAGRAKTMHRYIDYLLTLFPNEPAYFTPYQLKTECVGHAAIENPLLQSTVQPFLEKYNIKANEKVVLLLPGSRHNEVAKLLPTFLDAARLIKKEIPEVRFVLPTVQTVEKRVQNILNEAAAKDVLVINQAEERFQAMKSACFAIAASGTVSLELAIAHIPHLIAYKVAPLTAWLARHFLKIKSVNLPNLILGETAIPELLQEDCQAEKIMDTALPFIQGTNSHEKDVFLAQMRQLDGLLGVGKLKPSRRAAQLIIKEIEQKQ